MKESFVDELATLKAMKDLRKNLVKISVLQSIIEDREEDETIPGIDVKKCLDEGIIKYQSGVGFYVPTQKLGK